jgi:hypothetical protein
MSKVIYNGKLWDYKDLPKDAKLKLDSSLREKDFARYEANEALKTYSRLDMEQNTVGRIPIQWRMDKAKARKNYWYGCSPEMNK